MIKGSLKPYNQRLILHGVQGLAPARGRRRNACSGKRLVLEPVFTIFISRFYGIKARIQGKKHSKVEHLASIFNAVAAFLGH